MIAEPPPSKTGKFGDSGADITVIWVHCNIRAVVRGFEYMNWHPLNQISG